MLLIGINLFTSFVIKVQKYNFADFYKSIQISMQVGAERFWRNTTYK